MPAQKISLLKSLKTSVNTLNVGYNNDNNNAPALYNGWLGGQLAAA